MTTILAVALDTRSTDQLHKLIEELAARNGTTSRAAATRYAIAAALRELHALKQKV